jgi:hypothetical protein
MKKAALIDKKDFFTGVSLQACNTPIIQTNGEKGKEKIEKDRLRQVKARETGMQEAWGFFGKFTGGGNRSPGVLFGGAAPGLPDISLFVSEIAISPRPDQSDQVRDRHQAFNVSETSQRRNGADDRSRHRDIQDLVKRPDETPVSGKVW